jgi:hypothetical protein
MPTRTKRKMRPENVLASNSLSSEPTQPPVTDVTGSPQNWKIIFSFVFDTQLLGMYGQQHVTLRYRYTCSSILALMPSKQERYKVQSDDEVWCAVDCTYLPKQILSVSITNV